MAYEEVNKERKRREGKAEVEQRRKGKEEIALGLKPNRSFGLRPRGD